MFMGLSPPLPLWAGVPPRAAVCMKRFCLGSCPSGNTKLSLKWFGLIFYIFSFISIIHSSSSWFQELFEFFSDKIKCPSKRKQAESFTLLAYPLVLPVVFIIVPLHLGRTNFMVGMPGAISCFVSSGRFGSTFGQQEYHLHWLYSRYLQLLIQGYMLFQGGSCKGIINFNGVKAAS